MKKTLLWAVTLTLATACTQIPEDGHYRFHVFTTNDVHGRYFDEPYNEEGCLNSLYSVAGRIESARDSLGSENVILLDGGDFLQGENAAYYYNFVDTANRHVYCRMSEYLHYDAAAVGNHDIEAGHNVFDRIKKELKCPYLAANAIDPATGKPHFKTYTVIRRQNVKIAVVGFTNPHIRGWVGADVCGGLEFPDLLKDGFAQKTVDDVISSEKPDLVIVVAHVGSGKGDGSSDENEGRDLLYSLKNVDVVVCAHDHAPYAEDYEKLCLVNSGSHSRGLGHAVIDFDVQDGKICNKKAHGETITLDKNVIDEAMKTKFNPDFEKVKTFSCKKIGVLSEALCTRDAYTGPCPYIGLLSQASAEITGTPIAIVSALEFNSVIPAGNLIYNDLFKMCPFENFVYSVRFSGSEIVKWLEYSYGMWINTVKPDDKNTHLLKIVNKDDARTGQKGWSFENRYYMFDCVTGLNYTVDITKPEGSRVNITSLTSGEKFSADSTYVVTVSSYRANGGGGHTAAAGIEDCESRITARHGDLRGLLYRYFQNHNTITTAMLNDTTHIGTWKFIPEKAAGNMLKKDMELLFGPVSDR